MKTYNNRIAFLISSQHFIPHGGIGSFCKSFTELGQRLNWKVDVILDKNPNTPKFAEMIAASGANIRVPKTQLTYTNHTATFAFTDTINFEKIINFRQALVEAFAENVYDMIVCNTQEAMTAAFALTIGQYIPVVFYTHLHSMIFRESQGSDVFLPSYHTFYNKHMEFTDVIIGTQSKKNITELTKHGAVNCRLLPMPMSERGLLEPSGTVNKSGVLFIGRWEEGKNPEAYIKVMKECKLPCKVMTNSTGAKKFEKAFASVGITDYEIKIGITGAEKVDFITKSKVFFMPSVRENYPFAFMECLGHAQCVVLDVQDWSDNFDSSHFHKVALKDAASTISMLHERPLDRAEALRYVCEADDSTQQAWMDVLTRFQGKRSKSNAAAINSHQTICHREFINGLGRSQVGREDIESVLANRHKFPYTIYTDDNTFLSKSELGSVPVSQDVTGVSLFEGL